MRVALYARVSTTDKGQDPATQLLPLRRAAAARGWADVREYVDRVSGARERRPGLDALLAAARAGEVQVLLIWRLDRLGRSLTHLVDLVRELERYRVDLVSLTETLDTTTAAGRLLFHIMASLAQFERELTAERVRAGLDRARAAGKRLGRPPAVVNRLGVREDRAAGMSLRVIAQRHGVGRSVVARILEASAGCP